MGCGGFGCMSLFYLCFSVCILGLGLRLGLRLGVFCKLLDGFDVWALFGLP